MDLWNFNFMNKKDVADQRTHTILIYNRCEYNIILSPQKFVFAHCKIVTKDMLIE